MKRSGKLAEITVGFGDATGSLCERSFEIRGRIALSEPFSKLLRFAEHTLQIPNGDFMFTCDRCHFCEIYNLRLSILIT